MKFLEDDGESFGLEEFDDIVLFADMGLRLTEETPLGRHLSCGGELRPVLSVNDFSRMTGIRCLCHREAFLRFSDPVTVNELSDLVDDLLERNENAAVVASVAVEEMEDF